jgi:hypothetical protein
VRERTSEKGTGKKALTYGDREEEEVEEEK